MLTLFVVQMQTPSSPLAGGSSGGRKASKQIILVCHGQSDNEVKLYCLGLKNVGGFGSEFYVVINQPVTLTSRLVLMISQ